MKNLNKLILLAFLICIYSCSGGGGGGSDSELSTPDPDLNGQTDVNQNGGTPPLVGMIYYIDPDNGNDSTGQVNDPNYPFQHWSAVTWTPGCMYLQKRGTTTHEHNLSYTGGGYATIVVRVTGTSSNPITIGAYGTGTAPIIDGNMELIYGIVIISRSYVTIQDIEIKNVYESGIEIRSSNASLSNIVVQRVYAHHCGGKGVFFYGSGASNKITNCSIQDSIFNNCAYGVFALNYVEDITISNTKASVCDLMGFASGSSENNRCYRIKFYDCESYNNLANVPPWANGVSYTKAESRALVAGKGRYICLVSHTSSSKNQPESGANWLTYWYQYSDWTGDEGAGFQHDNNSIDCEFWRCNSHNNEGHGFQSYRSYNSTIINCFAHENDGYGLVFNRPNGTNVSYNNTSVNNLFGAAVGSSQTGSTVMFANNILAYNNRGLNLYSASNVTEDHNCFYSNKDYDYFSGSLGRLTLDVTDITFDPKLTGYIIASDSPCRNNGASISTVNTDYLNYPRPYGSAYDIGCYEWR